MCQGISRLYYPCQPTCLWPHPAAQDLVDGSTLLECAFCNNLGSHLLHVQHEGIEWLLDGWFLGLLLSLGFCLRLPEEHMSRSLGSPHNAHLMLPPCSVSSACVSAWILGVLFCFVVNEIVFLCVFF